MRILGPAIALAFSSVFACSAHVGAPSEPLEELEADGGVHAPRKPVAPPGAFATSAVITEVALFQGTRVSLELAGTRVAPRKMQVVQGRDALVRAYLTPSGATGAATGKTITGELYVVNPGTQHIVKDTVVLNGPSREESPETTFDFEVPGGHIQANTSFYVRLLEDGAPIVPPTTPSQAQYPTNGIPELLEAQHVTDKLRVVLVPIQYGGDGSNRTPDTSPNVLDAIKKRLLEFYPVPDVEVTVHAPLPYYGQISGTGTGWDEVLQKVTQLRLAENAPADVYYYGGFAPAPTLRDFCSGSCILGLSNSAADAADETQRVSVGVLYAANDAIDTVPHELGHAHGRQHAPCGGSAGNDPSYPYGGALTQTWGYSIVTRSLKPPTFYDQMSYCMPAWQSDYTYIGLAERIRAVSALRGGAPSGASTSTVPTVPSRPARTYRMMRIAADGAASWAGQPFESSSVVLGEAQSVKFHAASGELLGEETGHAFGYSHLPGATVIVPYDGIAKQAARLRFVPNRVGLGARMTELPLRDR